MSFFRIQTQHHLANTPESCKVSLTRLSGRAKGQVGVRIAIGAKVLQALQAKPGDRTEILWGRDEDLGKIMLMKSEHGVTVKKTRESKYDAGYMTFCGLPSAPIRGAQGEMQRLMLQPKPAEAVEWKPADTNGVLITLPGRWFETAGASKELKALTAVPMPLREAAQ